MIRHSVPLLTLQERGGGEAAQQLDGQPAVARARAEHAAAVLGNLVQFLGGDGDAAQVEVRQLGLRPGTQPRQGKRGICSILHTALLGLLMK